MSDTVIINIAGGPGVGKTTIASLLFSLLKQKGYEVENIPEFSKELIYEGRNSAFNDRFYMHAMQNHRLFQLDGKVDFIITDSPLFLTSVYYHYYLASKFSNSYTQMLDLAVSETTNYYNNRFYYLKRSTDYQNNGRRELLNEAELIDQKILDYLFDHQIPYIETSLDNIIDTILQDLHID